MNNKKKITIITATNNSEKFIRNNLQSVSNQKFENYEQIIVDNCSTDKTIKIINDFKSPKVRIICEPDKGIYDAINKGIKVAEGSIISILHSDDEYYDSNVLFSINKNFEKYQTDIIYGNLIYTAKNNNKKIVRVWQSKSFVKRSFNIGWSPPHPSFFVKKILHDKYGYYINELGNPADLELMHRFLEVHQLKNVFVDSFYVKMRLGGKSNKSIINIIKQNLKIISILKLDILQSIKFILYKFLNRLKQFL